MPVTFFLSWLSLSAMAFSPGAVIFSKLATAQPV
jgi:hypothetical protein